MCYFCNVKWTVNILLAALAGVFFLMPASATDDKRPRVVRADSVRAQRLIDVSKKPRELSIDSRKMATSTFPVRMVVKGSSLCVTSDYSQILPIYTRGGAFYMAMRLNKGLNWLNGLPRGRYLINRQQISIP